MFSWSTQIKPYVFMAMVSFFSTSGTKLEMRKSTNCCFVLTDRHHSGRNYKLFISQTTKILLKSDTIF